MGHGPRTDGNPAEYHDDCGRFSDERDLHATVRQQGELFAPQSASLQDVQLKTALEALVEQMSSFTAARMRAGQSSVALHDEKSTLSLRVNKFKPKDTTDLLEHFEGHTDTTGWDTAWDKTLDSVPAFAPSLIKDTYDMVNVDDQLGYVDKVVAQVIYNVAMVIVATKVKRIDKDLTKISADFRTAVAAVKKTRHHITELQQLMTTIRNYRQQGRHHDVPPLVRSTLTENNMVVPSEWATAGTLAVPAAAVTAKRPAADISGASSSGSSVSKASKFSFGGKKKRAGTPYDAAKIQDFVCELYEEIVKNPPEGVTVEDYEEPDEDDMATMKFEEAVDPDSTGTFTYELFASFLQAVAAHKNRKAMSAEEEQQMWKDSTGLPSTAGSVPTKTIVESWRKVRRAQQMRPIPNELLGRR